LGLSLKKKKNMINIMASSSSSELLLITAVFALASWQQAVAFDPGPLQAFCVADLYLWI
jgi:hypothetical protein